MSICDTLDDCHRLMKLRAENKGLKLVEDFGPGMANDLGGRTCHTPDMPQPDYQRHQVHTARR